MWRGHVAAAGRRPKPAVAAGMPPPHVWVYSPWYACVHGCCTSPRKHRMLVLFGWTFAQQGVHGHAGVLEGSAGQQSSGAQVCAWATRWAPALDMLHEWDCRYMHRTVLQVYESAVVQHLGQRPCACEGLLLDCKLWFCSSPHRPVRFPRTRVSLPGCVCAGGALWWGPTCMCCKPVGAQLHAGMA